MRDGGVKVVQNGGTGPLGKPRRQTNGQSKKKGDVLVNGSGKTNGHGPAEGKSGHMGQAKVQSQTKTDGDLGLTQAVAELDLDDDPEDKSDASSSSSESSYFITNLPRRKSVQIDQERALKECRKLQRVRSIPVQLGVKEYRVLHGPIHVDHRKRKLIIHLDIRNTILVADSITNVSVEEVCGLLDLVYSTCSSVWPLSISDID
ncbi:hypothetical protein EGW08_013875 [Elysia chlorotica]|uniref:Uncharacterized protein n=1 Tax=Elysia chlorotica TaxID=188477 RepID=A0A433T9V1_ELYCH|nr:hypothetical protein EGW08_013875 [Elysia chlorotica]